MTFTRRFPAAARLVVEGAIDGALRRLRDGKIPAFGLDEQEKGELEVTVAPVEEAPACVVDFDELRIKDDDAISLKNGSVLRFAGSRTDQFRSIMGAPILTIGEADEQPIAAHGVADEDGA